MGIETLLSRGFEIVDEANLESELNREMGWFGLFGKKKGEIAQRTSEHFDGKDQPNMSRRNFLKTSAGVAAMAGAVGTGLMKPQEVLAASGYPPGIEHSTYAIKYAWASIKDGDFNAAEMFLIPGKRILNNAQANRNEYENEPATYLCLAYVWPASGVRKAGDNYLVSWDPMLDWAEGIGHYISYWVQNNKYFYEGRNKVKYTPELLTEHIEKPLLSAIFKSATIVPDTHIAVKDFMNGFGAEGNIALQKQAQYLQNVVMPKLKKANHREQLIAAWASTWLNNYYLNLGWRKSIQGELKIKGRNGWELLEKIEKQASTKIRGPPYYYDSKGGIKI